jgi:hypothetical protein
LILARRSPGAIDDAHVGKSDDRSIDLYESLHRRRSSLTLDGDLARKDKDEDDNDTYLAHASPFHLQSKILPEYTRAQGHG